MRQVCWYTAASDSLGRAQSRMTQPPCLHTAIGPHISGAVLVGQSFHSQCWTGKDRSAACRDHQPSPAVTSRHLPSDPPPGLKMRPVLVLCSLPVLACAANLLGANHPCWDEHRALDDRKEAAGGVLPPGATYPSCDRLGRYAPQQCKGSVCSCVTPNGDNLRDEGQETDRYTVHISERNQQTCRCAREEHEISLSGNVGVTLSCDEKGDYRHTQCRGSACFCVHPHTGEELRGDRLSGHVAQISQLSRRCEQAAAQQQ